ncbi:MAG: PD-(D/E)XK nuclease family protein [Cetobacterium sp.]|uniref:PD-(D/E)XK nuclease family protein n=1 Tax=Cetobacterium sp. TaxID=2071632 RepID=UPI003F38BE06
MKGLQGLKEKLQELRDSGVDVWSISRLDKHKQCPQGYKYGYVTKIKSLPGYDESFDAQNIYSYFGSAFHDCQERIYNTPGMTLEEAKALMNESFEADKKVIAEHNSKYAMDKLKPSKERTVRYPLKFKDEGVEDNFMKSCQHYIDNYYISPKKRINEAFFVIEIEGVWVQGYVDAIQADDPEKKTLHIIDYKTSTKYTGQDKTDKGRQLLLYAYAIEQLTGYKVTRISWDYIKYLQCEFKGKTRKRKDTLHLRKNWVMNFLDEMRIALLDIGTDEFDVPNILAEAIEKNEIPDQIKHMFVIRKGYCDYKITEENMAEMLEYVTSMPKKILADDKFKPMKIDDRSNFFCNQLCNARLVCPTLYDYNEKQRALGLFEKEDDYLVSDEDYEDLFG